jgi:hypothetical protein
MAQMTNIQSRAARIGARIRAHLASERWDWRYQSTVAQDDIDAAALATLRRDRDRAARWLELASAQIGLPLPAGNGSGGPWERSAVVDAAGRLGLADIAAGRIAWTDATVPTYVRRFVVSTPRVCSPSECGGSGAMGTATGQVALTYGMHNAARPTVIVPRIQVTQIEYGLTTCYGHVGLAPSAEEYMREWAALVAAGVQIVETPVPQWDRVTLPTGRCSVEMAQQVVRFVPILSHRCQQVKAHADGEWRVLGSSAERARARAALLATHAVLARLYVEHAAARARCEAGIPNGNDREVARHPFTRFERDIRAMIDAAIAEVGGKS